MQRSARQKDVNLRRHNAIILGLAISWPAYGRGYEGLCREAQTIFHVAMPFGGSLEVKREIIAIFGQLAHSLALDSVRNARQGRLICQQLVVDADLEAAFEPRGSGWLGLEAMQGLVKICENQSMRIIFLFSCA